MHTVTILYKDKETVISSLGVRKQAEKIFGSQAVYRRVRSHPALIFKNVKLKTVTAYRLQFDPSQHSIDILDIWIDHAAHRDL